MDEAVAKRMQFQQATPFARAIGLELLDWSEGGATTRLPPSGPISRAEADGAIHPWALIGMADHALSYVFPSVLPPDSGLATLDLRIDFGPQPAGAVTAHTMLHHRAAQHGTALLTAADSTGAPVLAASALFNFRSFPGGGSFRRPDLPRFENDHAGPFPAFLGLHQDQDKVWLTGGARRTVGFEGLPALHGGVIGALLAASCESTVVHEKLPAALRLTTLQIRFLRPAGLGRLDAGATILRAGRSAAFLTATCWHNQDETIAEAQATFAPHERGTGSPRPAITLG
jgi:acyl-coenzyme A thioesterase PaaI-like protein